MLLGLGTKSEISQAQNGSKFNTKESAINTAVSETGPSSFGKPDPPVSIWQVAKGNQTISKSGEILTKASTLLQNPISKRAHQKSPESKPPVLRNLDHLVSPRKPHFEEEIDETMSNQREILSRARLGHDEPTPKRSIQKDHGFTINFTKFT